MPSSSNAPELPQQLLKRIGVDDSIQTNRNGSSKKGSFISRSQTSRKAQRKTERQKKKLNRYAKADDDEVRAVTQKVQSGSSRRSASNSQRKEKSQWSESVGNISSSERFASKEGASTYLRLDMRQVSSKRKQGDKPSSEDSDALNGDDLDSQDDGEADGGAVSQPQNTRDSINFSDNGLKTGVKQKLAQDEADIDDFERKLGIRKGRKSLPRSFKADGLDELLADLSEASEKSDQDPKKRKRQYEEWIASKRQQKLSVKASISTDDNLLASSDESDAWEGIDSEDSRKSKTPRDSSDEDDGYESATSGNSDQDKHNVVTKQRENPYVPPTTRNVTAKYQPPHLQQQAGSEDEVRVRLRKQLQGLINRLTDANMLSIVQTVNTIYSENARGNVTEVLTDIVLAQVCKSDSLPDQFFVLNGGFIAAIYKVVGPSFAGHLIRRFVEAFGNHYKMVNHENHETVGASKESSNIITFISQLYVFEVISCKIIFDFMERLLNKLSELNIELLLRICRMAGRLLRRDDPSTLKHVAAVLNNKAAAVGHSTLSVRANFMIDTLNDLRNNKSKAKVLDSVVVSEHVIRTKKQLGGLKTQSRRLDGLAPMGMSLQDIEGADTYGKWWLVGASVPVKTADTTVSRNKSSASLEAFEGDYMDHEDMDSILPDYPEKARSQGLVTYAQIAIFTAIMSATNHEQGYKQFLGLGLKKQDQLEIATVIVQCVGSETPYNPYYALVGNPACANSRIRFAFQNRLWRIFRSFGESLFGEPAEDEDTAESDRMKDEKRIGTVAHLYASLIMERSLTLSVLKPLNLPQVNSWTRNFLERLVISLLQECRAKEEAQEDDKVEKVFGAVRDLPVLAAGLGWFLRTKIEKTKFIDTKALRKLERVRTKAQGIFEIAQATAS